MISLLVASGGKPPWSVLLWVLAAMVGTTMASVCIVTRTYLVADITGSSQQTYTGQQLHAGLPIELPAGREKRLVLKTSM